MSIAALGGYLEGHSIVDLLSFLRLCPVGQKPTRAAEEVETAGQKLASAAEEADTDRAFPPHVERLLDKDTNNLFKQMNSFFDTLPPSKALLSSVINIVAEYAATASFSINVRDLSVKKFTVEIELGDTVDGLKHKIYKKALSSPFDDHLTPIPPHRCTLMLLGKTLEPDTADLVRKYRLKPSDCIYPVWNSCSCCKNEPTTLPSG